MHHPAGRDLAEPDLVGQDMVGQDLVGQDLVGQDMVGQDMVGQDMVGQDPARQDPAGQDLAGLNAARLQPAEPGADRTGQHFPRRSRGSAVRRTGSRPDFVPPAEQPNRQRINHPRGETRRRISTAATEVFPAVSDATHVIPAVPIVEGYGTFDTGQRDGRADSARPRDSDGPARPRPRPRPRPGAQPGDDRQPARSTVYVSRHAAEPT
jgi:hypothetical protein